MTTETKAVEFRFSAGDDAEPNTFDGYASLFDTPDLYGDVIRRGAFSRTLGEHRAAGTMPALFWSHDPREVIGVWTSMTEDERGLKVTGKLLPEVRRAAEVQALMRAGAVTGISIGFSVRKSTRDKESRVITDLQLYEASLVSLPGAPKARVTSVRHHDRAGAAVASFTTAVKAATRALTR